MLGAVPLGQGRRAEEPPASSGTSKNLDERAGGGRRAHPGRQPDGGKTKIVVLLAREGIKTSASTIGRILKSLMDRGRVTPVPTLRRRPGGRRFRLTGKERHARRLPKGLKPTRPGELVQVDTLFVNVAPNKAVKHFTAYDPVAKWTVGLVAGRATSACATTLLEKLVAEASQSEASGSTADRSSWPPSRKPVRHAASVSTCCPLNARR